MRMHFIGIGGIGISALAQYYLKTGHEVSGSDLASSEIIDLLKKSGAKIFLKHKSSNLPKGAGLVLITPAVTGNNPELKEAKRRGVRIQTWEENLGELTKEFFTIAVSGSHGKSTTTALVSLILTKAGLNPTVIIGTKLKEFGNSNFRFGGYPKSDTRYLPTGQAGKIPAYRTGRQDTKYLVIESDEYKSSFLNYWPSVVVLTNLEYEHPDYFRNFQHYLGIFKKYLSHLQNYRQQKSDFCKLKGTIVANKDDKNVVNVTNVTQNTKQKTQNKKVIFYSLKQKKDVKRLRQILKIPGWHNISNALAALAVARTFKIPDKISFKALSDYRGAWRRFEEHKFNADGLRFIVISDYGHHPTQVKATIQAAREKYPKNKIWIVYQAHQYLRTYYLFNDYVKAFDEADEVVLPEIYYVSGRENKEITDKLSAKDLAFALKNRFKKLKKDIPVHFLEKYEQVPDFLKPRIENGDVIIVMGAGDIYKLINQF